MNTNVKQTEKTRARYDRSAALYDTLYWPWENLLVRGLRRKLWSGVSAGKILEIGPGTGINFRHHPPGAKVTAVELSPKMLERSRKRAAESKADVEVVQGDAEDLEFADDLFDAVVATFVYCSVPDQSAGLHELTRVVKPGGTIHLLEHVRIDLPVIGKLMDLWDPIAVRMGGAHINRRTAEAVRTAGLEVIEEERHGPGGLIRLIKARVPDESGTGEAKSIHTSFRRGETQ